MPSKDMQTRQGASSSANSSASALERTFLSSRMPSEMLGRPEVSNQLYEGSEEVVRVPDELFDAYDVKRGLRNKDGSGVLVGLTTISNVHGYNRAEDGTLVPDEGDLLLRGYSLSDLVDGATRDGRFGYEEMSYLLIAGKLPTKAQLKDYQERIDCRREFPNGYLDVFPMRTASSSIMNVLQRCTLLLYAFDKTPDDTSPIHEVDVACSLLGRLPRIAAIAQQAALATDETQPLVEPPIREGLSMAETILDVLRGEEGYTPEEARMLDVMLMLHAEHGGGNNSTFSCRVLSSSGTDAYSSYAAAMGSLKGPKHGGANERVGAMVEDVAANVKHWDSDAEVEAYLEAIAKRQAFDRAGLVYGIGHAVYTISDPRAVLIKGYAESLAREKGELDKFHLIERIETIGPRVVQASRGTDKPLCANVDLYSGFVYSMLGIPTTMHTPIFAIARLSGWVAHRMEELYGSARIIRPAYNSHFADATYVPLSERG